MQIAWLESRRPYHSILYIRGRYQSPPPHLSEVRVPYSVWFLARNFPMFVERYSQDHSGSKGRAKNWAYIVKILFIRTRRLHFGGPQTILPTRGPNPFFLSFLEPSQDGVSAGIYLLNWTKYNSAFSFYWEVGWDTMSIFTERVLLQTCTQDQAQSLVSHSC